MIIRLESSDSSYQFIDYLSRQMLEYYGLPTTDFYAFDLSNSKLDQVIDWVSREKGIQGYHLTFFNKTSIVEFKDSPELTLELLKFRESNLPS